MTHSADELARLADHLVVMHQGRIAASGPAAQVLATTHPLVVGDDAAALLHGVLAERDETWHLVRATFSGGSLWLRDDGHALGQAVRLRVLARDVSLATERATHSSIQNLLPSTVVSIAEDAHPSQALVRVRCGDALLLARVTHRAVQQLQLAPGSPVWAQVKSVALVS